MIFSFPEFSFDIDVEKTKAYYDTAKTTGEDCGCSGCRNYEKAIETLPIEVKFFFAQFGVDVRKFREVYVHTVNDDETVFYGGFTHICGRVIKGKRTLIPEWMPLAKDFEISYTDDCSLLEDTFPRPAIQLEILANLPWVLEEPNEYKNI